MTNILVPYHLDEHRPELDVPAVPDTAIVVDLPAGDAWKRMACLYDAVAAAVAETVRKGERPVVMSGDCTTSLGTVTGLQRERIAPSIVWFDGHGDVQTPETTTSGYLGGMPLRLLVGYRPELIAYELGLSPIPEENVLLVDARDLDPPEKEYLASSRIRRCRVDEISSDVLPEGPLYLHLDCDVADPGDIPGLVFPAPNGPPLVAVAAAIRLILDTGRVAALGIACTWHAGHGAAERVRIALADTLGP